MPIRRSPFEEGVLKNFLGKREKGSCALGKEDDTILLLGIF